MTQPLHDHKPHRALRHAFLAAALLVSCAAAWFALREPAPIRIGFVGQMEGPMADLGVQGRNGAQLAVEHVNAAGLLPEGRLELVPEHEGPAPEDARTAAERLIAGGIVAGVGHMTSGHTVAALPVWEAAGIPLVSPTASTPELAGKADGFFRVIPANTEWAEKLAELAWARAQREIAIIRETDNDSFSGPFASAFSNKFRALGGAVTANLTYSATAPATFDAALLRARQSAAEGVLLSCPARDVARAARDFRANGFRAALYCSPWSYTRELLLAGGRDAEGMVSAHAYAPDLRTDAFMRFRSDYANRFGGQPGFAAAFAYEAVLVLAHALALSRGDPARLHAALPEVRDLPGVLGPVSLDAYGDVKRRSFLLTIRDGDFVTLQ